MAASEDVHAGIDAEVVIDTGPCAVNFAQSTGRGGLNPPAPPRQSHRASTREQDFLGVNLQPRVNKADTCQ
jgi:hypothetical protein